MPPQPLGIRRALSHGLTAAQFAAAKEEERQAMIPKTDDGVTVKRICSRHGVSALFPNGLTFKKASCLCASAVQRENGRLPQDMGDLRMARARVPRNRTDADLRSGMPFEDVVRKAAMRILEDWVHVLREFVEPDDMVDTIAGILFEDRTSAFEVSPMFPPEDEPVDEPPHEQRFDKFGRLRLSPNPTPPADTLLGAALRRLVPPEGTLHGPCAFIDDIMEALDLEDGFNASPSSPIHINRPNTGLRCQLNSKDAHEAGLDQLLKPACMKKKDIADTGAFNKGVKVKGQPSTSAHMRLSYSSGGWSTFSKSTGNRVTMFEFNPKDILSDMTPSNDPTVGTYKKPGSAMRPDRIAVFPSVGKLRTVASAHIMGSVCERFTNEALAAKF